MDTDSETARVLGISVPSGKARSALWISHAVNEGLPISALEKLVGQVAPDDRNFIYNFVSKPTLARRRKASFNLLRPVLGTKNPAAKAGGFMAVQVGNDSNLRGDQRQARRQQRYQDSVLQARSALLSPTEGAKVARLAEVWTMARQVWGNDSAARAFLFRPHPLLDNSRPIDVVLESELGRPLVEQLLGRLQYGSAA